MLRIIYKFDHKNFEDVVGSGTSSPYRTIRSIAGRCIGARSIGIHVLPGTLRRELPLTGS